MILPQRGPPGASARPPKKPEAGPRPNQRCGEHAVIVIVIFNRYDGCRGSCDDQRESARASATGESRA